MEELVKGRQEGVSGCSEKTGSATLDKKVFLWHFCAPWMHTEAAMPLHMATKHCPWRLTGSSSS